MAAHDQKVRWGILSTANIGKKLKAAIDASSHAELVAVASRSIDAAIRFLGEAPAGPNDKNVATYGSYEELLLDPVVEVVYIPVPSALKREWGIKAAQHGKHVLCEKPFACAKDVLEIAQACKENGVCFMDGTMFVHNPRTKELADIISRGDLGELATIHSEFTFHLPKGSEDNIRLRPQLEPLGALGDLGWYTAKATLEATFFELPTRVYGAATFHNGVIYSLSAILWYHDEKRATFNCGFDTAITQTLRVSGGKKSLLVDDFVIPYAQEPFVFPQVKQEETVAYRLRDGNGLVEVHQVKLQGIKQEVRMVNELSHLVERKRADRTAVVGEKWPREAHLTQRILDALAESVAKGVPVELL